MSAKSVLHEIEKLPDSQIDLVLRRLLLLRARRIPRSASARERVLLANVARGAPPKLLQEYRVLIVKRRAAGLGATEQARLITVSDELEAFNVRWLRWLSELARIRNTTVAKLVRKLELPARPYV